MGAIDNAREALRRLDKAQNELLPGTHPFVATKGEVAVLRDTLQALIQHVSEQDNRIAAQSDRLGIRGTSVDVDQLPNGFWRGRVEIRIIGHDTQFFEDESFRDPDEAFAWTRFVINTAVHSEIKMVDPNTSPFRVPSGS